jgi:hypothetical protein
MIYERLRLTWFTPMQARKKADNRDPDETLPRRWVAQFHLLLLPDAAGSCSWLFNRILVAYFAAVVKRARGAL